MATLRRAQVAGARTRTRRESKLLTGVVVAVAALMVVPAASVLFSPVLSSAAPARPSMGPSSAVAEVSSSGMAPRQTMAPALTVPNNYTATFNETGLANGTLWDIALLENGTNVTLSAPAPESIEFTGLWNSTYSFSVSVPPNYTASPSSGNISLVGLPPGSENYTTIAFTVIPPCCGVVTNPSVGLTPAGEAYDPRTHQVFVSNWAAWSGPGVLSTVTVLGATYPFPPGPSVTVGNHPNGEAYDPITDTMWVANWGSDTVSEICDGGPGCSGAAYAVVATVDLSSTGVEGPYDIAYDSVDRVMAVTDLGYGDISNAVTIIAATTTSLNPAMVTVYLPPSSCVGCGPTGVAYDLVDSEFFVTQRSGVYVLYLQEGTWEVASLAIGLPAGSSPGWLAWDSRTNQMFVVDAGTHSVDVVDATLHGGSYDSTISLGPYSPWDVAYDAVCDLLFVSDHESTTGTGRTVTVISDITDTVVATVPVGPAPAGVVYDYDATYQGVSGAVFVANYAENYDTGDGNVSVIVCPSCTRTSTVPVEFTTVGLASGTSWSVQAQTFGGAELLIQNTTAPGALTLEVPNGSLAYSFSYPADYVLVKVTGAPAGATGSTNSSASISGATALDVYFARTYSVTFNETGLQLGTAWAVTLNGTTLPSTGSSIAFTGLSNGAYPFTVARVSGYTEGPSSGTAVVTGADVSVDLTFTSVNYAVTVTASGLPPATTWYLNLTNGQSFLCATSTLVLSEPNGTYSYGVGLSTAAKKTYSAPAGSFGVEAAATSTTVTFVLVHPVTFKEKGLPLGTAWWVNVSGSGATSGGMSSVGPSLRIWEPRGTYTFTVASANKEYAAPSGTLTVKAGAMAKSVKFSLVTYAVTFTESGLPTGAKWCVDVLGGKTYCTRKTSESNREPNGTYDYLWTTAKKGYAGGGGTFAVNGTPVSQAVTFTGPSGVPAGLAVEAIGVGAPATGITWLSVTPVLGATGVALALGRTGRGPRERDEE